MKQERIRITLTKDGYTYNFERFPLKTVRGVLSQYTKLAQHASADFFLEDYFHATKIVFSEINNGEEIRIIRTFTPSDFMNAIGYNGLRRKTDSEFFKNNWYIQEKHDEGKVHFCD